MKLPYLSKMKELNQIALGKGFFISTKGHLCLRKGYLDNPERQVEVKSPLVGSCFRHKKKKKFFQKGYLTKLRHPDALSA